MNGKVYMTKEKKEETIKDIEKLKEQANNILARINSLSKNSSYSIGAGHSAGLNSLFNELSVVNTLIKTKESRLSNTTIFIPSETNENIVNINDKVTLKLIFSEDEFEIDDFTLVAGQANPDTDELSHISPLGEAIFLKEVGTEVEYIANDYLIKVEVLAIQKQNNKNNQR